MTLKELSICYSICSLTTATTGETVISTVKLKISNQAILLECVVVVVVVLVLDEQNDLKNCTDIVTI